MCLLLNSVGEFTDLCGMPQGQLVTDNKILLNSPVEFYYL